VDQRQSDLEDIKTYKSCAGATTTPDEMMQLPRQALQAKGLAFTWRDHLISRLATDPAARLLGFYLAAGLEIFVLQVGKKLTTEDGSRRVANYWASTTSSIHQEATGSIPTRIMRVSGPYFIHCTCAVVG